MQEGNAKQSTVEQIKGVTNILVTVSTNPSVDELSAALALTLMLNKIDKHATAVFSGELPKEIQFLQADKTFESTVNSLRDFIIALDKEKADRLRYKVEDDVVRIFITPYRTTITQEDLQFSQGDFNIELVIALGVTKSDDLDRAIAAHGRILHDATVVTINAKNGTSSLGSVDWQDSNASSLCEMLMSLSEALEPKLLDEQIATALLTGIVSATERFSNQHTTPRVMTMSAQLMAAGANQQLIATKLQHDDGSFAQRTDQSSKKSSPSHKDELSIPREKTQAAKKSKPDEELPHKNGEMHVRHDPIEERRKEAVVEAETLASEAELGQQLSARMPAPVPAIADLEKELEIEATPVSASSLPKPKDLGDDKSSGMIRSAKPSWMGEQAEPPQMGSALSATSQQALDDAIKEQENNRKHLLLSHEDSDETPELIPGAAPISTDFNLHYEEPPMPAVSPQINSTTAEIEQKKTHESHDGPSLEDLEAKAHAEAAASRLAVPADQSAMHVDQARDAVTAAFGEPAAEQATPLPAEAPQPEATELPPKPPELDASILPPLPDFSTLPPLPEPAQPASGSTETPFADPLALPDVPKPAPQPEQQPPAQNNDPGQFRIPSQ